MARPATRASGAYRDAGGDRPVVLLSADDRLPYFRPYVSKEYLVGDVGADELGAGGARLVRRQRRRGDPGLRGHGHRPHQPRGLDGPRGSTALGPLRAGDRFGGRLVADRRCRRSAVLTLRHASDTERLLAAPSGPVVVVGSGFVGCEAAAGLRRSGREVTVVSQEAAPQADRLGSEVGALIAGWLRDSGIEVRGNVDVADLERHGDELTVTMSDGTTVATATVLLAVGAEPQLDLAASIGLVDDEAAGVAVSPTMQTVADGVLAVGDIAMAWHPSPRRSCGSSTGATPKATAHGRPVPGRVTEPWTNPPGFWSTIAGETIKHVAWGDGYDELRVVRSTSGETFWYGARRRGGRRADARPRRGRRPRRRGGGRGMVDAVVTAVSAAGRPRPSVESAGDPGVVDHDAVGVAADHRDEEAIPVLEAGAAVTVVDAEQRVALVVEGDRQRRHADPCHHERSRSTGPIEAESADRHQVRQWGVLHVDVEDIWRDAAWVDAIGRCGRDHLPGTAPSSVIEPVHDGVRSSTNDLTQPSPVAASPSRRVIQSPSTCSSRSSRYGIGMVPKAVDVAANPSAPISISACSIPTGSSFAQR